MQELVVNHDVSLTSNMAAVRESIAQAIAKYSSVVVTEDAVLEAKDLMATLNKQKKAFIDQCKSVLSIVSAPIDAFKKEQKEIEALFDEGRAKIESQVKVFEEHKLAQIAQVILQYREDACAQKGVNPNSVVVSDLEKLSAATLIKNGYSLTKATKEAINLRIQAIENEMLRARLEAEEKARHDREVAEKARQEAEERARQREAALLAKAEQEKAEAVAMALRQAQAAQPVSAPVVEAPIEPVKQVQQSQAVQESANKCHFKVTVTLEINTPKAASPDQIKAAVSKKFQDAGFSSVKEVVVS
ncbi:MAG: DUF1351 domain-containing protein [Proteobacteria bacterium]|nr:DUF1351 domain-containing protein [Pseudomonadota bacterium]